MKNKHQIKTEQKRRDVRRRINEFKKRNGIPLTEKNKQRTLNESLFDPYELYTVEIGVSRRHAPPSDQDLDLISSHTGGVYKDIYRESRNHIVFESFGYNIEDVIDFIVANFEWAKEAFLEIFDEEENTVHQTTITSIQWI